MVASFFALFNRPKQWLKDILGYYKLPLLLWGARFAIFLGIVFPLTGLVLIFWEACLAFKKDRYRDYPEVFIRTPRLHRFIEKWFPLHIWIIRKVDLLIHRHWRDRFLWLRIF